MIIILKNGDAPVTIMPGESGVSVVCESGMTAGSAIHAAAIIRKPGSIPHPADRHLPVAPGKRRLGLACASCPSVSSDWRSVGGSCPAMPVRPPHRPSPPITSRALNDMRKTCPSRRPPPACHAHLIRRHHGRTRPPPSTPRSGCSSHGRHPASHRRSAGFS